MQIDQNVQQRHWRKKKPFGNTKRQQKYIKNHKNDKKLRNWGSSQKNVQKTLSNAPKMHQKQIGKSEKKVHFKKIWKMFF